MELPTAVPYFGATALLTAADLPIGRWLPLLVLYNAIFILPPVLLLVGHIALGRRMQARYADLRERLQAGGRETFRRRQEDSAARGRRTSDNAH